MKRRINKKRIILSISCLILIIAIVAAAVFVILSWSGSSKPGDILEKINSGEVKNINKEIEKLDEWDHLYMAAYLVMQTVDIKKSHYDWEMTYKDADRMLENIGAVEMLESASYEARKDIKTIYRSRIFLIAAAINEQFGNYVNSIDNFMRVDSLDAENHLLAQEKIETLSIALDQSIVLKVESAEIIIQSERWKTLYPDLMRAVVYNTTEEKTIKDYEVGFLAYDENGDAVKIKSMNEDAEEEVMEFIGIKNDAIIKPQEKYGEDYGWELVEVHGIHSIIACVKKVTFEDDTEWENPLYPGWVKQYKGKALN